MPKFEQDVYKDGIKVETVTLEVLGSLGVKLTLQDASGGEALKFHFTHETANVVYDLMCLMYPTHSNGERYQQ